MLRELKAFCSDPIETKAVELLEDPHRFPGLPVLDEQNLILQLHTFSHAGLWVFWTFYRSKNDELSAIGSAV